MLFVTTSMIWCQVEPSDDMFVNVFFCSLKGKWSEFLQVSGTSGCITFIRGALAVNMDMADWTKKLVIIVNKILLIILIFCNFLDATHGHSKFYSAWLTVCSVSLTDDWPELATSAHCGYDCSDYFITPMVICLNMLAVRDGSGTDEWEDTPLCSGKISKTKRLRSQQGADGNCLSFSHSSLLGWGDGLNQRR